MKHNILLCLDDDEIERLKQDLSRTKEWLEQDEWTVNMEKDRIERYVTTGVYSEKDGEWYRGQARKRLSEINRHRNSIDYIIGKLNKDN
jgi:hypothetical protein